ncbi:DnaJ-like protein [Breoghania corrubedonensis]|uniref:DnaJ-like protein n=1 Tax=Breoghania corrubedonensis TaxID=665038 RepID=A0A2T5VCL0_9HYPH|nr:DnaJ domain-containing protein [Breoghania corrubedonensis]PTW61488.1 DnaJ-like protein [Breoghania corrubedonensis]
MAFFLIGAVLLLLGLLFANSFAAADPARLAFWVRMAGGVLLLTVAAIFAFSGRLAFALPIGALALSVLGWRSVAGFGRTRSRPSPGKRSTVRSAMLEMELDHDSGDLSGRVIAGAFDGRDLDALTRDETLALWQESAGDGESRALLEAYLDRRHPGWRVDFEADGAARHDGTPGTGPMSEQEAYQVLGLPPGAGEAEIRAAHRRLMLRMHPDQGGSTFLAAKINEAKDRLLRNHGSSRTRN